MNPQISCIYVEHKSQANCFPTGRLHILQIQSTYSTVLKTLFRAFLLRLNVCCCGGCSRATVNCTVSLIEGWDSSGGCSRATVNCTVSLIEGWDSSGGCSQATLHCTASLIEGWDSSGGCSRATLHCTLSLIEGWDSSVISKFLVNTTSSKQIEILCNDIQALFLPPEV